MAPSGKILTRSANEVMVLAAKAARGAGAPPAQSTQFGRAAVWHLGARQEVGVLAQALEAVPQGPILALPIAVAQMAEQAQEGRFVGPLPMPVCALAQSYIATLPYTAEINSRGIVMLDLNTPAPRQALLRIDLPEAIYALWSSYAARLLVPETETSRLSGAGAGLTDND